jgi:hypothetical protein
MTITDIERRALEIMSKVEFIRCAHLGDELWPKSLGGSNPMSRPAGAVLARLRKKGFIEDHWDKFAERTDSRITAAGREAIGETK